MAQSQRATSAVRIGDGAAQAESNGFFDLYNTPPWDTWVSYFEDVPNGPGSYDCYLLAYVPRQLLPLAAGALLVNPEECILWLSDADVKLRSRLSINLA